MTLGPSEGIDAEEFVSQRVRPAVWTVAEATRLRAARPIISVDTGMRRFACERSSVYAVIEAGAIDEAFTHATRIEHVEMLKEIVGGRKMRLHAAGSSLLQEPRARLDAVRPGMAMYRGAVRLAYPLVEVRSGKSPAGYTGFVAENFGVIVRGYSNGLRAGPCIVNGVRRRILEVGMQSAFVELGPTDKVGDELVLLGDGLTEAEVAAQWGCSEQQALFALARMGRAIDG
jgi:alanine racemase